MATHQEVADDYIFRAELLELLRKAIILLDKVTEKLEDFK